MDPAIKHFERSPLGNWWVWQKRELAQGYYYYGRDLYPGKETTQRAKRGRFRVKVRVKSVFRYRVMARFYHVKTDRNPAIINHAKPLHFKTLGEAILAGRELGGSTP